MNRKFILALMLASGMAFAQTGGTGSTPDQQQQPSQQPTSPSTSPSTTPDQSSQNATAPNAGDQQASMKGCLKQSGGNWVLAADNGQSVNLQGDSSMLKPHDGHQVQIQGTRASDGSVQVSSVNMISDSCTSNQAATSTAAGAAGAVSGAATGAAAAGSQAADKTADAAKSTADTAADATKSAAGDAASATKGAAADAATAAQANPPSTQSTPDQSQQPAATTAPGAAATDQTAPAAASTGDQNAAPADQSAKAGQKLPQTASPLPLLGLLGLGSMAAGLIGRKKK